LQPANSKKYLDCTFGAGGYTKAILGRANCFVKALDQDPTVFKYAEELAIKYQERFEFVQFIFEVYERLTIWQEFIDTPRKLDDGYTPNEVLKYLLDDMLDDFDIMDNMNDKEGTVELIIKWNNKYFPDEEDEEDEEDDEDDELIIEQSKTGLYLRDLGYGC